MNGIFSDKISEDALYVMKDNTKTIVIVLNEVKYIRMHDITK